MKLHLNFFLLLLLAILSSCHQNNATRQTGISLNELPKMLENQCLEWNKGNLEGYMSYYWQSDSLRFITEKKDIQGWDSIYSNYKKSFPKLEDIGKLSFSSLKTYALGGSLANVTGQWHIQRPKGNIGGKFSLICRYDSDHWVIVVDHTW